MTRFLIVEASPGTSADARAALEDAFEDAEVVESGSGADAMRVFSRGSFDLVIADLDMPNFGGLEIVRFLRGSQIHRSLAIVVTSTRSSERDRARAIAVGADAHLDKPFTREALCAAATNALAARRAGTR